MRQAENVTLVTLCLEGDAQQLGAAIPVEFRGFAPTIRREPIVEPEADVDCNHCGPHAAISLAHLVRLQ
jgi:hypothetical protein